MNGSKDKKSHLRLLLVSVLVSRGSFRTVRFHCALLCRRESLFHHVHLSYVVSDARKMRCAAYCMASCTCVPLRCQIIAAVHFPLACHLLYYDGLVYGADDG